MKISEIFGEKTFNKQAMMQYLPKNVFDKLTDTLENGLPLDREIASSVAHGLKEWAISHGVTHYTHWFHPLRGATAEKHEAFIHRIDDNEVIERFSEKELIQQEPDASSFPSGGMRSTFEARGYTAWDPTSMAFIWNKTLCIPSVFISFDGEVLDKKTPLIKSTEKVEEEAYKLLKLFGNRTAKYVRCTIGAEQEYFLMPKKLYEQREDLYFCQRTLFGSPSPKDQQLEDHYFGSIKQDILDFMVDFEQEMYKLGIPVKTRHNEVAPNQYEFAPIFEYANRASDHNALAMDVMKNIADKHDFVVLFHEKPFDGVNGSGKHINWSLMDSDEKNLLKTRRSEKKRLQFLIFLMGFIKGVRDYAEILKLFSFSYSNEFRLGGHEAPPSIISVFIGKELQDVLDKIMNSENLESFPQKNIQLGLSRLPEIKIDFTDRNRTSPIAFTGDKFEFRMAGSSFSIASIITTLNMIVYSGLNDVREKLEKELPKTDQFDVAVLRTLQYIYKKSKSVIFNGDCYSAEWKVEAVKRGMCVQNHYFDILRSIDQNDLKNLFVRQGVFSEKYCAALLSIDRDIYLKSLNIEIKVLITLYYSKIYFYASQFIDHETTREKKIKELNPDGRSQINGFLHYYIENFDKLQIIIFELEKKLKIYNLENLPETRAIPKEFKKLLTQARENIDYLESHTPDHFWKMPKYKDFLF